MTLNGTYEFYFTPRISVRRLGWMNPGFSVGAVDSLMQVLCSRLTGSQLQLGRSSAPASGGTSSSTSDLAVRQQRQHRHATWLQLPVAASCFLNRTIAVKGEGRYHAIEDARGEEPSVLR